MTTTTLVVMEPGARWPGNIGDSMNLVAFGQEDDDLLRRTQEKLNAADRHRQSVRVAVLACNQVAGGAAADRRAALAHLLLRAVAKTTGGQLILSTTGRASGRVRQELLALAGDLTERLQGTTATISLQFADASPMNTARAA